MSWRHSPELLIPGTAGSSGEPAGWSAERYKSAREALAAGQGRYGDDAVVWTAWVVEQPYAAQLPPARQLLADAQERAAERGSDTSSFDALTDADRRVLDDMLRKTLTNWEAWLVSGDAAKRSSVVLVENQERHVPRKP